MSPGLDGYSIILYVTEHTRIFMMIASLTLSIELPLKGRTEPNPNGSISSL
jgi:hypothetical protein